MIGALGVSGWGAMIRHRSILVSWTEHEILYKFGLAEDGTRVASHSLTRLVKIFRRNEVQMHRRTTIYTSDMKNPAPYEEAARWARQFPRLLKSGMMRVVCNDAVELRWPFGLVLRGESGGYWRAHVAGDSFPFFLPCDMVEDADRRCWAAESVVRYVHCHGIECGRSALWMMEQLQQLPHHACRELRRRVVEACQSLLAPLARSEARGSTWGLCVGGDGVVVTAPSDVTEAYATIQLDGQTLRFPVESFMPSPP